MTLVYDIEKRRPACALIQAGNGCDSSLAYRFPTESWLLGPTEGMCKVEVNEEQLEALIKATTDAL